MDKIIIFGSNGHIGSKLFNFINAKYDTYASSRKHKENIKNFIELNLNHQENIDKFVKNSPRFNVVIFLVGLVHSKGMKKDLINL